MKVVTYISCESEYVGMSESGNEAMYLLQLQGELDIGNSGVLLYDDNESSFKLAEKPCLPSAFQAYLDQISLA